MDEHEVTEIKTRGKKITNWNFTDDWGIKNQQHCIQIKYQSIIVYCKWISTSFALKVFQLESKNFRNNFKESCNILHIACNV